MVYKQSFANRDKLSDDSLKRGIIEKLTNPMKVKRILLFKL